MLEKHLKCKDMSKQMRKKYANTEGNLVWPYKCQTV